MADEHRLRDLATHVPQQRPQLNGVETVAVGIRCARELLQLQRAVRIDHTFARRSIDKPQVHFPHGDTRMTHRTRYRLQVPCRVRQPFPVDVRDAGVAREARAVRAFLYRRRNDSMRRMAGRAGRCYRVAVARALRVYAGLVRLEHAVMACTAIFALLERKGAGARYLPGLGRMLRQIDLCVTTAAADRSVYGVCKTRGIYMEIERF